MKNAIYILFPVIILAGCFCANSGIKLDETVTMKDGTVKRTTLRVKQPNDPEGGSMVTFNTNGLVASSSASQSRAEIDKANGQVKNKRLLYGACGLILLVGAIALALPNQFVSNKDAMLVLLFGFVGVAVLMWVDSASKIMGYALPAIAIGAVAYIAWQYHQGKIRHIETEN